MSPAPPPEDGIPPKEQRRRMREMQRRLEELDRHDARLAAAGIDPYDAWLQTRDVQESSALARERRRGRTSGTHRRLRAVLIVLLVLALPIGGVWLVGRFADPSGGTAARGAEFPPPGREVADAPLGTPAAPPPGPDTYQFMRQQSGGDDPVTWDPCRPIHYMTNGLAPKRGQEILASAFARLSEVTGFNFINDGPTTEPPSLHRRPYQPDRYPDRWAPVLVAWTDPTTIPDLGGAVIGLGGGIAVGRSADDYTYVSGILYLDSPQIQRDLSGQPSTAADRRATQIRALMLHEMGHLVGLAHVDDPSQLMFPSLTPEASDYGVGDLRGLARLSAGPCRPEL